jgi:L-lactate dehydrogenase complex protein LldF
LAREKAKNIKWRAIETLDKLLEAFEVNSAKRGVKLLWAETAD